MGGGRKIPFPKWVWSPAGGFYAAQHRSPDNWQRNTAIFAGIMGAFTMAVWKISDKNTVEYKRPELKVPPRLKGHH